METGYIVVGILGLVKHLPVKSVLGVMVVELAIHVPSDFLRGRHWVWVLFLGHCGQHLKFLLEGVHRLLVLFAVVLGHLGGLVRDHQ